MRKSTGGASTCFAAAFLRRWWSTRLTTSRCLVQDGPATQPYIQATASCKHIPLYDTQTPDPNVNDFNVSVRDMFDYYLVPWRACALAAHSASMMCSYGR